MTVSLAPLSASSPRYHRVAVALRQRIRDGAYAGAFPMPGERELAKEFGVGRVTVRTALAGLAEEGLVTRVRGKGTLPLQSGPDNGRLPVRGGLIDYLLSMGRSTQARVLEHRLCPAAAEVAGALRIETGASVLKVVRIREFEGRPISYTTAFVPGDLAWMLPSHALRRSQMVALMEEQGVKVVAAEQSLCAAVAEAGVAETLMLSEAVPLLRVTRTAIDESGRPVQHLVALYHPARYEYHMRLSRVGRETNVWVQSDPNRV